MSRLALILAGLLGIGYAVWQVAPPPEPVELSIDELHDLAEPGAPAEPVEVLLLPNDTAHVSIARRYIGVRETGGNNRGPEIDRFLAAAGLGPGHAWCAAFGAYCFQLAEAAEGRDIVQPAYRGALARHYIIPPSIPVSEVRAGRYTPRAGDLIIWGVIGSWSGHFGFVAADWTGLCGLVIEGNTSGRASVGVDRDGDGVYLTRRCIPGVQPRSGLAIHSFTPVIWDS